MTINLTCPWPNRLYLLHSTHHHQSKPHVFYTFQYPNHNNNNNNIKAALSESYHANAAVNDNDVSNVNDDYKLIIDKTSAVKDATEALQVFGEMTNRNTGVVSTSDCCSIISASIDRNNADLALSIFKAMRSSFDSGNIYCTC